MLTLDANRLADLSSHRLEFFPLLSKYFTGKDLENKKLLKISIYNMAWKVQGSFVKIGKPSRVRQKSLGSLFISGDL